MQINTFFISHSDDGTVQGEMNAFLRGHRVLKVDHASVEGGWAFCVEWLEGTPPVEWTRKPRVDWKERLEPTVFERFSELRARRKGIAADEGVPPYMVMTDAQLAEAAKPDRLTLAWLKQIEGFGESRVAKYGARLVGCEVKGAVGD